jgi:triphosphoribosyl-dephospho-CoA synthase
VSPENLGSLSAAMTAGICRREYAGLAAKQRLSHGERTYLLYRTPGARGEAESGFHTLCRHAYPALAGLLDDGSRDLNDTLVQVLLVLLAEVDDTNIYNRKGADAACQAKQQACGILRQGGALTPAGRAAIERLDEDFIRQRISPGGCADLLAATLFVWMLSHPERAVNM